MESARIVELLSQNAAVLAEDLELMERGTIKFTVFDTDVNHEASVRMKANLARLMEVIDALGPRSS